MNEKAIARVDRLPLALLTMSGADGFARCVNAFTKKPAAGDYFSLSAPTIPLELNARRLVVHLGDGDHIQYIVLREPVSCNWIVIQNEHFRMSQWTFDVYDLMWLSYPFNWMHTQEQAVETILLSHGFLAPWITTKPVAERVRRGLDTADSAWRDEFLRSGDFGTEHCEGCDECEYGENTIHRIPRLYEE